MELRQLRYFVRTVELGSMGRAALDLGVVQSALSQQISRLEGELATRLLQRSARGVLPTDAGAAFFREAQLTLRHAEQAQRAARSARLTGTVSVGLAPTTAAVLAMPLMRAMRERYPDVRLHMVESLSGHLAGMLNARQLDLAVLFSTQAGRRWSVMPLLEEKLLLIRARRHLPADTPAQFVFGASGATSPGISLLLNDRAQVSRYAMVSPLGAAPTEIRMGVAPYLAYDILYDADRGTMAVRARSAFTGGPLARP